VKSTFWPYSKDPYEIYELLLKDPRMPKSQMARRFKVNPATLNKWWNHAVNERIIVPPIFRRKSFTNFREYFYFLNVEDPHRLYEYFQIKGGSVRYFSVQTGFCNFHTVSSEPIHGLEGEIILSGARSDYFVSVPPNRSFQESIAKINVLLNNLGALERRESPLKFRKGKFLPWNEKDEAIFNTIYNDVRIPFASIVESVETYNDKTWSWFKNRKKFGDVITYFFPEGEAAYIPSLYFIDTESANDSVIIDIFRELPTAVSFYRLCSKLIMLAYLPFTLEGRSIVRKALSILQKEELVDGYTNSIVEYHYRT
jgi:hypothetical protein